MDIDLNSVALLLRVVREGTLSAAARELRLPVSSVSRRIAALEAALGTSLLARTTRSLRLTDDGRLYVERAGRAVEELAAIHSDLLSAKSKPHGRVRVTAPVALGHALSIASAALLASHPAILLELDLSDQRRDLIADGFDIALRAGSSAEPELVARKLLTSGYHLFASPSYLRRSPRLRELDELHDHRRVASAASGGVATWTLWRAKKKLNHRFEPTLLINEMSALTRAVVEGVGIGLLPSPRAALYVARGDLVRVLPEWRGPEGGLWMQYARRTKLSAAAAVVVDHYLSALPAAVRDPSLAS